MGLLNGQTAFEVAHELTVKAIENDMICQEPTSEETAKEIAKFFTTLFNELSNSDD